LILLVLASVAIAKDPPKRPDIDKAKETFLGEGASDNRARAGVDLAFWAPDTLAEALDELVEKDPQDPKDAEVIAKVAVQTKPRHVRLLLGYAASRFGEVGVEAMRDKIDNDHPHETVRAIGILGFMQAESAWQRLVDLLRHEDERIAVMAARALARIGSKRQAGDLVETALTIGSRHVRTHIGWAVQDMVGSQRTAVGMFNKYAGKPGAIGSNAKEIGFLIMDELAGPEKYKVKFETVRSFFTPKRGVHLPKIKASKEHRERIEKVLGEMKEKVPAYYHLICTALDTIEVSGGDWRFDHRRAAVNLRFADLIKWDRDELLEYYLVRYATIVFLARMGDPTVEHRGWEEGMIDAWWYAMDHTLIALPENLNDFIRQFLKQPPW
jgi:hypothetical protein